MDLQIASLICLRHVNDGNSSMQFTKPANRSTGVVSQNLHKYLRWSALQKLL